MELVSFAQDVLQSMAEHAASYKIGQSALRHMDWGLWVVEKCARWAVPPPLDQDDRPQPELVRPLPWVFFLMMLIALRITRESISIVNLIMGKPPLRSVDVVMYIQSKRRYLRTLKYQGNRIARARSSNTQPRESWYSSFRSLFEFTMCFSKASAHYGNNNSTNVSNNDEVLIIKDGKPERESTSPVSLANAESTMERLIEKMMVELNADSDDDSCFTITTIATHKSDRSQSTVESDTETDLNNDISDEPMTPNQYRSTSTKDNNALKEIVVPAQEKKKLNAEETPVKKDETPLQSDGTKKVVDSSKKYNKAQKVDSDTKINDSNRQKVDNGAEKDDVDIKKSSDASNAADDSNNQKFDSNDQNGDNISQKKNNDAYKFDSKTQNKENKDVSTSSKDSKKENDSKEEKLTTEEKTNDVNTKQTEEAPVNYPNTCKAEDNALNWEKVNLSSLKEDSINFLQQEKSQAKDLRTPKHDHKLANGRAVKSVPIKKRGGQTERRESNSAKSSPGNY